MHQPPRSSEHAAFESGTVAIEHSGWTVAGCGTVHHALREDVDSDVAVIGAGVVGASLTLHLAERGIDTVLLEAHQPASGASGRNAGHVLPYLGNLEPLREWPDGGRRLLEFFVQHRDIVFDLCARHGIDADASRAGIVVATRREFAILQHKASTWKRRGYAVEAADAMHLRSLLGTDRYRHGLHWNEGGRVNPYLFTNGMVDAARRLGARVHGNSAVLNCERCTGGWRLRTASGSVTARRVVLCTNGHEGNAFFSELGRTHYPLLACALSTRPLPRELLEVINPARVTLMQFPFGLYPLVLDGRDRLLTATIPGIGQAASGQHYFAALLRYLHRTWPASRDFPIELENYWTGMTANPTPGYQAGFPKLYQMADGVLALMNFGAGGNVLGPVLGMNLAHAIAADRPDDMLLPLETPVAVHRPGRFEFKIRRVMIPSARLIDRLTGAA